MTGKSDSSTETFENLSRRKARLFELLIAKEAAGKQRISPYPRPGDALLPTSWAQQRLWFVDQLEGAGAAYNLPVALTLRGVLDEVALRKALDALVQRHEVLRTRFVNADGVPRQEIQPTATFILQCTDLLNLATRQREDELRTLKDEELRTIFDLDTGPLIRGRLLRLEPEKHFLLITMHHIVADGASLGVLVRELGQLYSSFVLGTRDRLAPLPIQYADYAQWQREWLSGDKLQEQLAYWVSQLQGAPAQHELPTDRPRGALQSYRGGNVATVLDAELSKSIRVLARRHGLTLFMILYAAWALLLARLSGRDDIVIGTPVANRRRPELEGLIGFFVNTLVLRVAVTGNMTLAQFLRRVKQITLGAYDHQDVPFEQIVEALRPDRSLSRHPLFQVAFAVETSTPGELRLPGLVATLETTGNETAKFDLLLAFEERGDEIVGNANYATDLFEEQTIAGWLTCLQELLRGMARADDCELADLAILPDQERRRILEHFNDTRSDYPNDSMVHELFERWVHASPDAPAAVYQGEVYTYRQLNCRANQLAHFLRARGVGPNSMVGICVDRSLAMVVACLGVLKAGGAYVPLDPSYPAERLDYMLEDASPKVVLTQEFKTESLSTAACVVALDREWSVIETYPQENIDVNAMGSRVDHLAYVIYTSGSTGAPKGVMVTHRGLCNLASMKLPQTPIEPGSRILQFASFSFDACAWEWMMALCGGACLYLAAREELVPGEPLHSTLRDFGISHAILPPVAVSALPPVPGGLDSLRVLAVGGEACSVTLVQRWAVGRCFVNAYGPTEATVCATVHVCDPREPGNPPIGRPNPNTQIYILDSRLRPVPTGVTGEIYIGGVGVARGYLNRPELTAERFVPDPFSDDSLARMYRTGDTGRWRTNGVIDYLGRNDQQVKIRGFRIELGEIEVELGCHSAVKEAAVLVREDVMGDRRLVAYVVLSDPSCPPAAEELRSHLIRRLPAYMVPSAFVSLETLPITPNGKLDRNKLPAPDASAYARRRYEPPQGEMENALSSIWQTLLRVEHVGRCDNFFELGGHSLLVVQMLDRLRRCGFVARLRDAFGSATLADLAIALRPDAVGRPHVPPNLIPADCTNITPEMLPLVQLDAEQIRSIVRSVPGGAVNIKDIYPLAPLQEGILFHHLLSEQGPDVYVVPILLRLASMARVDELIVALQHVIDRHDVLRTSMLWEGLPRAVQVVHRTVKLSVCELQLDSSADLQEQALAWVRPERQRLNLCEAPLMRLQIASGPGAEWFVLLQIHHIIADAMSMRLLIAEIVKLLNGRSQQLQPPVPYRNHVAHVLTHADTRDDQTFFRSRLEHIDEPCAPFGLLNVHGDGTEVELADEQLEPELVQRVRRQARQRGLSTATLFHAAWALVVAKTIGRSEVVFGSVLLGRLQGSTGAEQTLGMFINTLPMRLVLDGMNADELVTQAQRELVELLSHEQASLPLAQQCSGVGTSAPLFTSLLNYRHSMPAEETGWASVDGIHPLGTHGLTNYPITISVDDSGDDFSISAQTDRRIDPHRVVAYLRSGMQSLVQALEGDSRAPVLALSILPDNERRELLHLFNATRRGYAREKTICQLFEGQVEDTPHSEALVHGSVSLTYCQLDAKANRLARLLRTRGVGPDDVVGVCLQRGTDMIVAVLGTLKAGGAYLPLDPSYPAERLQYMVRDAAPRVLITNLELRATLPKAAPELLVLEEQSAEIAAMSAGRLSSVATGGNPAYVIYTSGSTGQPKGTVMPHGAMVNLMDWHRRELRPGESHRVLQFAALSFDVAFQEIFSTLTTGSTLVLLDEWVRKDSKALLQLLEEQRVERLFVPPLVLQSLAECYASAKDSKLVLRDVLAAGEQLRLGPDIVQFLSRLRGCRLHNHYGPTETHVVTAFTLQDDPTQWPVLPPIGRPVANTQIYVLDQRMEPVPLGVAGEIYIGGANLARCYLGRPELTAHRFVPDPFSSDLQSRLYSTGDRGRWQADGVLEYLGRNDDQVKIRGFRIELGEIEARLALHDQVKDVAVVAREDSPGQKRLVAYLTAADDVAPTAERLRAFLSQGLPDYMIPAAFVVMGRLPLTPSGKLNRRALPAPDVDAYASHQYELPNGEVESTLARIWQEVLGVPRVGRNDNFFDLGGHSLLVLKILFKVSQALSSSLRVTDLYKHPTVRRLAVRLEGGGAKDALIDLAREATLEPAIAPPTGVVRTSPKAILLTGATGFVGRFLLVELLQRTDAIVYCLARASSSQEAMYRIRSMLKYWDLWHEEFGKRIVPLAGDLRLPRLGLDDATYNKICQIGDSIFHCATSMNHLETYAMAKAANVDAARELLRIASQGSPKSVNYISTFGVFTGNDNGAREVDEYTSIDNELHYESHGYIASKWVAEKLFMEGRDRGLACNIFRLGLVWADTRQGRYDELQHGYRMLKSCLLAGRAVMHYRYETDPIPVDWVARAIVGLAGRHAKGGGIFHIASGRPMREGLFERCNEFLGTALELMPFLEWVQVIKQFQQNGRPLPIVPLLDSHDPSGEQNIAHKGPLKIHSERTRRELEQLGLVAPALSDDLVRACLESMFARDQDLRDVLETSQ